MRTPNLATFKRIGIAFCLVALGWFSHAAFVWLRDVRWSTYKVCSVPVGPRYAFIDIRANTWQEVTKGLLYEVQVDDSVVLSPATRFIGVEIGRSIARDDFVVIESADKSHHLVGLAMAEDPYTMVVMYDFATNESWPRRGIVESFDANEARGRQMLARLQQETGKTGLVLKP